MRASTTQLRCGPSNVVLVRMSRRALVGGAAALLAPAGIAKAHFWIPKADVREEIQPVGWWLAFSAGAAAAWLVEAAKNYGLIPGAQASISPTVVDQHRQEASAQVGQGYDVNRLYSGSYSGGDIVLSNSRRGNDYRAFVTATHSAGRNTCTLVHHSPDILALDAVSTALRNKGVPTHAIQAGALPIHGEKVGAYDNYGHTAWREAMTPNGGSVRWMARESNGRPTAVAEVRSPGLRADVEYTA